MLISVCACSQLMLCSPLSQSAFPEISYKSQINLDKLMIMNIICSILQRSISIIGENLNSKLDSPIIVRMAGSLSIMYSLGIIFIIFSYR